MVSDFTQLLRCADIDLLWTGTQRDLVELTHFVWMTGRLLDGNGTPITFNTLVRRIFEVLHVNPPKRPSGVMDKLNRRKFIRSSPLVERYLNLMYDGRIPDPMKLEISRIRFRK